MTIIQKIILFIFSIILISSIFIEWKVGIVIILIFGLYYLIFIHTLQNKEIKLKRIFSTIYVIFSIILTGFICLLGISLYEDYQSRIENERYLESQKIKQAEKEIKAKEYMKFKSEVDELIKKHYESQIGFEYKINNIVDNFVKINGGTGPGGYYRSILMYDGFTLEEIESGNSDIECEIMDKYFVPKDLYIDEGCYDSNLGKLRFQE